MKLLSRLLRWLRDSLTSDPLDPGVALDSDPEVPSWVNR